MGDGIPTMLFGFPLLLLTFASAVWWVTGGETEPEFWRGLAVAWVVIAPICVLDALAA